MNMKRDFFGTTADGRQVHVFTLKNARGESARILDLGGTVQSLLIRGRGGKLIDVALGFDTPGEYLAKGGYLGAIVGRYANRIGGARFALNGKEYRLFPNDGKNHLHGGKEGFDKKVWEAEPDGGRLKLRLFSPHMDEGYPGNFGVEVTYAFSDDGGLIIDYLAKSDMDTVVNLTNHCYFNLRGCGDILSHELKINARSMLPTDAGLIPTGEIKSVEGTPFDFTEFKSIGRDIEADDPQLAVAGGYDHNFCLEEGYKKACELFCDESGILMEVFTDMPGVQFYSGNFLSGISGKGGRIYGKRFGLCLETQHYPDSVNKPHFPSPVLKAGALFRSRTVYKFGAR